MPIFYSLKIKPFQDYHSPNMEKYEKLNVSPSPEYNMYTAEYLRSLFTLLHNPYNFYPTANQNTTNIPTYKFQASEPSLQARENAMRYLLNCNQIEALRNLPRYRRFPRVRLNSHKKWLCSGTPDYLELNRRRPSVIRRSIHSGTKCSSPREAILEPNFEPQHEVKAYRQIRPVTPNYPPFDGNSIHKDPQLSPNYSRNVSPSIPKYPQHEESDVRKDPHLSTNDLHMIHKVAVRDHQKSPVIHSTIPFVHREPRPGHVSTPTTAKRPLVSEDEKSPTTPKKRRYSLESSEGSLDLSPRMSPPPNDMPPLIKITRKGDPSLSIDVITNFDEDSDLKISGNSPKSSTTAKPEAKSSKKEKKYKYTCFHCKKRFRWFSHWQAHERIHTGVRPYKCNQCDRSFTRGDGLQAHMVIHSTKKPHKCSTCSKLFARKSMLDRHIVEHTGILPYTCEVCQEELVDPESIEGHLAQHEGNQKFTCQYCQRRFANGRRLVRHIRAHTGKNSCWKFHIQKKKEWKMI